MHFAIYDRAIIESGIVVRTPYVIISITDPESPRPKIRKRLGLQDVLYLQFHDAEPVAELRLPREVVVMTEEHAWAIWDFVRRYLDRIGTIVVHCEQGMSRSPAVAAGICTALGGDPSRMFQQYAPNRYVYDLLVATASKHPIRDAGGLASAGPDRENGQPHLPQ